MNVIQKGYGEVKVSGGKTLQGEVTLYAEGWLAVAPVPPSQDEDTCWFPREQVVELVWRKSIAVQRPK